MFTVQIHNAALGIVALDHDGRMSREKPYAHHRRRAAEDVAKNYANKHKVSVGVHAANGKLLRLFRPSHG